MVLDYNLTKSELPPPANILACNKKVNKPIAYNIEQFCHATENAAFFQPLLFNCFFSISTHISLIYLLNFQESGNGMIRESTVITFGMHAPNPCWKYQSGRINSMERRNDYTNYPWRRLQARCPDKIIYPHGLTSGYHLLLFKKYPVHHCQ